MGRLAQALGNAEPLEFEGKSYKQAPVTLDLQSLWEEWLLQKAWRQLRKLKAVMEPAEWDEQTAALRREADTGAYDFLSARGRDALSSPEGAKEMLYLRLRAGGNGLDDDKARQLVERIFEARLDEAIARQEREREGQQAAAAKVQAAARAAGGDDPNSPSPAAAPGRP